MLSSITPLDDRESNTMSSTNKIRENRIRRMAQRQGLQLTKTRRRDERAIDYGGYILVNDRYFCVFGTHNSGRAMASLEEIENYLTSEPSGAASAQQNE